MTLFKEHVFGPLRLKISEAFLNQISEQRQGNSVDLHVLGKVSEIIMELRGRDEEEKKTDFYSELEERMLSESYKFYKAKSE